MPLWYWSDQKGSFWFLTFKTQFYYYENNAESQQRKNGPFEFKKLWRLGMDIQYTTRPLWTISPFPSRHLIKRAAPELPQWPSAMTAPPNLMCKQAPIVNPVTVSPITTTPVPVSPQGPIHICDSLWRAICVGIILQGTYKTQWGGITSPPHWLL